MKSQVFRRTQNPPTAKDEIGATRATIRSYWRRAAAAVLVAMLGFSGALAGAAGAQAATYTYASYVYKSYNSYVESSTYNYVTGGASRADTNSDGWYGSSVGQTRKTSNNQIIITVNGSPGNWVTWGNLSCSGCRNLAWWTANSSSSKQYQVSGRIVYS